MNYKKIFINEMLDQFANRLKGEKKLEVLNAKSQITRDELLLKTFFDTEILPLCDGIIVGEDVKWETSKDGQMYFASSVMDELYSCIIEPNIKPFINNPNVRIPVALMGMHVINNTRKMFFACVCEAVRIEGFAPLAHPSLRPDRVRTLQEEYRLTKCEDKVTAEGELFTKLCNVFCKS